jgi:HPt (histidine-containing phosphotransfer) domain-containing protein
MPELDGYEATRRLRKIEREKSQPRTPVIAVTAHALSEEREKVLQAGMDDLLTKPIQLATLTQTMAKWVPRARRLSPATEAGAAKPDLGVPAPPVAKAASSAAAAGADPSGAALPLLDPATPRTDRMWELFVQHSRDDIEFIQEAAAVADAESLRLRAHRLKGSAHAFGARQVGAKAAEIERMAIAGNIDVDAQLGDLIHLFKQTCTLIPRGNPSMGAPR